MNGERKHIPVGEDGEMLVHEDDHQRRSSWRLTRPCCAWMLIMMQDMAETMEDVRRAKEAVDCTRPENLAPDRWLSQALSS